MDTTEFKDLLESLVKDAVEERLKTLSPKSQESRVEATTSKVEKPFISLEQQKKLLIQGGIEEELVNTAQKLNKRIRGNISTQAANGKCNNLQDAGTSNSESLVLIAELLNTPQGRKLHDVWKSSNFNEKSQDKLLVELKDMNAGLVAGNISVVSAAKAINYRKSVKLKSKKVQKTSKKGSSTRGSTLKGKWEEVEHDLHPRVKIYLTKQARYAVLLRIDSRNLKKQYRNTIEEALKYAEELDVEAHHRDNQPRLF